MAAALRIVSARPGVVGSFHTGSLDARMGGTHAENEARIHCREHHALCLRSGGWPFREGGGDADVAIAGLPRR